MQSIQYQDPLANRPPQLDLGTGLGFIGAENTPIHSGHPSMRLAYFTQPVHPLNRGYGDVLQENLDAVILADKLGYQEALFGEHFT
ncbi:MAG: LLM class flavin-dependent oxidoreductase, partial [Rhodospirillaceae bacterium]|nr:LLM class flavin-dependent oxidoreductase [Rhodospirillaceae bacterium]